MKSGTEENTMDFGNMMKLMGAWNTFKRKSSEIPGLLQGSACKGT